MTDMAGPIERWAHRETARVDSSSEPGPTHAEKLGARAKLPQVARASAR
jgi:hypothetical protein